MLQYLKKIVGVKIALFVTGTLLFVFSILLFVANPFLDRLASGQGGQTVFLLLTLFFICLQVVLIFLAIGLFIGRPLQKIMASMRRIAQGQTEEICDVGEGDEFGELSGNLNKMMQNIRHMLDSRQKIEKRLVAAEEGLKYKSALEDKAKIIERMNLELSGALSDISLLYTVSQHLSSVLAMDDLLQKVRLIFENKLSCDGFVLLLVDNPARQLKLVASKNLKDLSEEQKSVDVGDGLAGFVVQKNRSHYVSDLLSFERSRLSVIESDMQGSVFCVPLRVREEVVGVLLVWRQQIDSFTPTDRQSLESIGSQIAVAFDRSLLHTKTKELSVRDELTDVYNRRYFYQMLHREFERAKRFNRPLSLIMIDLDHFKRLNDTFGHIVGDGVLKKFAQLIRDHLREIDVLARFGGEEFVVLLSDTAMNNAVIVAEKLRSLVRVQSWEPLLSGGDDRGDMMITISVGVAGFPETAKTQEELVHRADIALYQAKKMGRDRVCVFQPDQDALMSSDLGACEELLSDNVFPIDRAKLSD
ncbi:MAG TPA: diguanylate cyclase [bacterium]|nr:diguanylate cyclase [bacterium]